MVFRPHVEGVNISNEGKVYPNDPEAAAPYAKVNEDHDNNHAHGEHERYIFAQRADFHLTYHFAEGAWPVRIVLTAVIPTEQGEEVGLESELHTANVPSVEEKGVRISLATIVNVIAVHRATSSVR